MIVVSIAIHVVAFALLVVLSVWQVDELPGPSVDVKMFAPGQVRPGWRGPGSCNRQNPELFSLARAIWPTLVRPAASATAVSSSSPSGWPRSAKWKPTW